MAKTMTPSKGMTPGQIDKATASYRALLEKHAEEMDSGAVQTVLGQHELAKEQFAVFRRRVEDVSEMIIRRVKVDHTRTRMASIHATSRAEYLNREVVDSMPRGEGEEVEVCFFPLKKYTLPTDFQQALADHGLKPDPQAQAAVNEQDPAFADDYPNGTQWVNENGNHCYLTFNRWRGNRSVYCDRNEDDWLVSWWACGVREQPLPST